MKRVVLIVVLLAVPAFGQTNFFVDEAAAGAQTGTAANPWHTINWTTVNTALGSGNVNIFYSACNNAHNANEVYANGISFNRTTTGGASDSNIVTIDGVSQYNTNSASPSWAANVTPSLAISPTTNPAGWAATCKAQIGSSGSAPSVPFDSNNATGNPCRTGLTLQGFSIFSSNGQILNFGYIQNLHAQYLEAFRNNGGSGGPGVYLGPANQGGGCSGNGVSNVTVNDVWSHHTYGECFYIGASTPDPIQSATPNQLTEDPGLGNCMPNCKTGDNYLLQRLRAEDCAAASNSGSGFGQGDALDIKDGHTNLRVKDSIIRPSLNGGNGGVDGQGIIVESATEISGNYIEAPGHDCVALGEGWATSTGRGAINIFNNMCINIKSGLGHNSDFDVFSPNSNGSGFTVTELWGPVGVYNNSNYLANDTCILAESGSGANGFLTAKNNICQSTTATISGGALLGTHDFNDYFSSGSCPPAGEGAHSICTDPKFVSTVAPYGDTNFKLQAGSGAIGTGVDLSGTFTLDYFGTVRAVPFWMGAYQQSTVAQGSAFGTNIGIGANIGVH